MPFRSQRFVQLENRDRSCNQKNCGLLSLIYITVHGFVHKLHMNSMTVMGSKVKVFPVTSLLLQM